MTDAADFAPLECWLDTMMARLTPARRVQLARKVGQTLRQINAARVAANVTPDGQTMTARKPRPPRKTKKGKRLADRQRKSRMFARIEMAKNMRVTPGADQVALSFNPRIAATAAVHHFGLEDAVDRRIPNSIRVRYPARPLLGIGQGDETIIMAEVMAWIAGQ